MKRIEPGEVVEAYRKTGLKPIAGSFTLIAKEDGVQCGCAMAAVAMASGATFGVCQAADNENDCELAFADLCGLSRDYTVAFVSGFDALNIHKHEPGYADGIAARKAVIEQLGVEL